MAGEPIGKANIELGADTTKLDAGLSAAKAKTVAAVADAEKAVAEKQASIPESDRPAASVEKAAESAKALETNTRNAGNEAVTAGVKFAQLKAGLLAIAGAATKLWDGIKGARSAGEDFGRTMSAVETAFRADVIASLDALSQRREEIMRTSREQKDAIEAEIRQRGILQDLVAFATDDPEVEARRQKIETETLAALNRLSETKKKDTVEQDRIEADATLRNLAARRNLERMKAEDAAMIRVAAETEANRLIEEDRVRRAAASMQELARMQQAQFAQLRNDINGLFNTSGLEVGINRVGALIQTLIDKVGDNR